MAFSFPTFQAANSKNSMRYTSQRLFFYAAVNIHAKQILAYGLNKNVCKNKENQIEFYII
jgi:hypothetical protein